MLTRNPCGEVTILLLLLRAGTVYGNEMIFFRLDELKEVVAMNQLKKAWACKLLVPALAGIQADDEWHAAQSVPDGMCATFLPLAVVPLWQE